MDNRTPDDNLVYLESTPAKKASRPNPFVLIGLFVIGLSAGLVTSTWIGGNLGDAFGTPPEKVPAGLKAEKYLDLGKRYKQVGWTEQSRESLNLAIKLDSGNTGKQAKLFLEAYVPRYPISPDAVHKNIKGYNQMARGDTDGAIATFKECIAEYPKFEWPYGNLGSLYVEKGKITEAKEVLNTAVEINPHYVNGWLHLADAHLKEGDKKSARDCLQKASEADPDNPLVKLQLQQTQ